MVRRWSMVSFATVALVPVVSTSAAGTDADAWPQALTKHGCRCKWVTTDYSAQPGEPFRWHRCCGDGIDWCDVEPGCAAAKEAAEEYPGWDECVASPPDCTFELRPAGHEAVHRQNRLEKWHAGVETANLVLEEASNAEEVREAKAAEKAKKMQQRQEVQQSKETQKAQEQQQEQQEQQTQENKLGQWHAAVERAQFGLEKAGDAEEAQQAAVSGIAEKARGAQASNAEVAQEQEQEQMEQEQQHEQGQEQEQKHKHKQEHKQEQEIKLDEWHAAVEKAKLTANDRQRDPVNDPVALDTNATVTISEASPDEATQATTDDKSKAARPQDRDRMQKQDSFGGEAKWLSTAVALSMPVACVCYQIWKVCQLNMAKNSQSSEHVGADVVSILDSQKQRRKKDSDGLAAVVVEITNEEEETETQEQAAEQQEEQQEQENDHERELVEQVKQPQQPLQYHQQQLLQQGTVDRHQSHHRYVDEAIAREKTRRAHSIVALSCAASAMEVEHHQTEAQINARLEANLTFGRPVRPTEQHEADHTAMHLETAKWIDEFETTGFLPSTEKDACMERHQIPPGHHHPAVQQTAPTRISRLAHAFNYWSAHTAKKKDLASSAPAVDVPASTNSAGDNASDIAAVRTAHSWASIASESQSQKQEQEGPWVAIAKTRHKPQPYQHQHQHQHAVDAVSVPTPEELNSLQPAVSKLWELDTSRRLIPGKHYTLDLQRSTRLDDLRNRASRPLFACVDERVLERRTNRSFIALMKYYHAQTGTSEVITRAEREEQWDFLHVMCLLKFMAFWIWKFQSKRFSEQYETTPIRYVHQYLSRLGRVGATEKAFKEKMYELWFRPYTRVAKNDSSGFEHVFVGEERNGEVLGMHNWLRIYLEEKAGRLDYHGYIPTKPWRRGATALSPDEDEQLLQIQFGWTAPGTTEECVKRVGASFIGTSVQFDLALYTLCFLAGRKEDVHTLNVGPYKTELTCHSIGHGSHVQIGTAYPACAPMTDEEAATHLQAVIRGKIKRRDIAGLTMPATSAAARKNAKRRAAKKRKQNNQLG